MMSQQGRVTPKLRGSPMHGLDMVAESYAAHIVTAGRDSYVSRRPCGALREINGKCRAPGLLACLLACDGWVIGLDVSALYVVAFAAYTRRCGCTRQTRLCGVRMLRRRALLRRTILWRASTLPMINTY
jgi:hypothetical protein